MRLFDPRKDRQVPIEIVVGDGSPEQWASATGTGKGSVRKVDNVNDRPPLFLAELSANVGEPVSFEVTTWNELDEKGRIVIGDAVPGNYRLEVRDWYGFDGLRFPPLVTRDVTVKSGGDPIRIVLGSGSITGKIRSGEDAFVRVIVVSRDGPRKSRSTLTDQDGNFVMGYLQAGSYDVLARDRNYGWARVERVEVRDAITDIGEIGLSPGGSIIAKTIPLVVTELAERVIVVDPSGLEIEDFPFESGWEAVSTFRHLWPGDWTLKLMHKDKLLATAKATLKGIDCVHIDLVTKPDHGP